ncbi:microtubule-associated protein 10-like [Vombatus ursinus]|uniref:microtubule-associated protein 10-like n=1 Tax=Vombatus ursinus TaxID=29139 RepID=UPI000FFD1A10|nr:microtubule-associated protein 10-like [Vombatus ursinus]XP_027727135.1 microtubule-associated protein 10-like [Vombatus ursinus]
MATVGESGAERLFSLELLVDWVRLETRLLPPPPPSEDEEDAGTPSSGSLRLAVAFRLLDFPTLLVYPPGGPAAPSRGRRHGSFAFGRGKSCLFRLDAATLQRLLGVSPLYALLLTVPPGSPTPAPKLLGSCSISLAPAARGLIRVGKGLSATGASQGHRGLYVLRDLMGEQVGQIYLGYRLTDLGSTLLGHIPPKTPGAFQREEAPAGARVSRVEEMRANESSPPAPQGKQPFPPPLISFAQVDPDNLEDLEEPKQQEEVIEIVTCDKTKPKQQEYVVKIVKTPSKCNRSDIDIELTDSSHSETTMSNEVGESISPKNQEVTELELETNIICPPPLYYSNLEPKKIPPAKGKFVTVPQISMLRESNDVVQKEKLLCALVMNHDAPSDQSQTAMAQSQPDQGRLFDQDKLDTIRQLPLLNALLVELSLLYKQPLETATGIHPHLSWLYRPEDGKAPEPSDNATCKTEKVGDKFLPVKKEEVLSPPLIRKEVRHKLRRGVCFEKNSTQKKVVPRRKLFYGLTNTLKLRLKRTNPNMLLLHEKREQYRKTKTEMPVTEKLKILPSKGKNSTEEPGKPHALPSNLCFASDVLFAKNIKTLKQDQVESGGQSSTKETHISGTGTEKERNVEIKTNKESFIETVGLINSILPEKVIPTNVSERFKKEGKVHLLDVDTENTRIENFVIDFSNGANETVGCDFHPSNSNDSKPSKNSLSESISELKYSDDFTSPCYSEDFSTADDTFGSSRVRDSSPELEADNLSYSYLDTDCKSSESRMSRKSHRSEINSVLTPPFSAGSPVHSFKKSHLSKSQGRSLVDGNSVSSNDLSLPCSEGKKKHDDQNNIHNSEMRNNQGGPDQLNLRTGHKSLEKSQSLRTSQVSSYLPSNMSELELSALDSIASDQLEENDELGSLDICQQYKDICELVINKLPGYTV